MSSPIQWWTISTRDLHDAPFSSNDAPFAYRDVWCARDLPAQGIVLPVTRTGLQVWHRESCLCLAEVGPPWIGENPGSRTATRPCWPTSA